jgi:hypothetical protein
MTINGDLTNSNNAGITGTLTVGGNTTLKGTIATTGDATIAGTKFSDVVSSLLNDCVYKTVDTSKVAGHKHTKIYDGYGEKAFDSDNTDANILIGVTGDSSSTDTINISCMSAASIHNTINVNTLTGADNKFAVNTSGVEQFKVNSVSTAVNGNLGVTGTLTVGGNTTLKNKLDVSYGGLTALFGADSNATTRTDNTIKYNRIGLPHYTNAEEPVALLYSVSNSTDNTVIIGGGTSAFNAATSIRFNTAANNTTTTGTIRMEILSSGNIAILSNYLSYDGAASKGLSFSSANRAIIVNTPDVYGDGRYTLSLQDDTAMAAGIGAGLIFQGKYTTAGAYTSFASIKGVKANATDSDTSGQLHFQTRMNGSNPATRMMIDENGKVGIGVTAPLGALDISYGGLSLVLGADSSAFTRTDNTDKLTRIGSAHYTNTEEPLGLIYAYSTLTSNDITIGGGSGSFNAATKISFFTAANTTTVTGTKRMEIGTYVTINGDKLVIDTAKTPANASDTGVAGSVCWDASYVYVCTATNAWKRAAISTW